MKELIVYKIYNYNEKRTDSLIGLIKTWKEVENVEASKEFNITLKSFKELNEEAVKAKILNWAADSVDFTFIKVVKCTYELTNTEEVI